MPRQPPPGRGARIAIEEKNATLMSGQGDIIASTVGKLHGGGYFQSNQHPKGEWKFAKVFNRGTLLWDRETFYPGDPVAQSMHVHYSEESYDYGAPRRLLVGYSIYTLEPVLASVQPEVSHIDEFMAGDYLSGLQFEAMSEGFLDECEVILHHALTVPGNLRALKSLLVEKDWKNAFFEGDLTVEGAKDLVTESPRSLYDGCTPIVVACIKPATTVQVPNHKKPYIERYLIPDQPYEPGNRQLQEVLPCAMKHLYFHDPPGFVYKAPYMSNIQYPARFYQELAIFAKAHSSDKFNATAMLFAVQLWIDIEEHPDKMLEGFVDEPLPSVSLAVFIVYFEHWLKIHEHLECIGFVHPFRLIHLLYWNDILVPYNRSGAFYVKEDAIDCQRVRRYVLDAQAKDPEVSVRERVDLYPFMMSGTKMVYPQDIPDELRLSETQQATVGMPDLRILGPPSYPTKDSEMIEIAMPEPIARITFLQETSDKCALIDFFDAAKNGPTSQFGNSLKSGTIWTHEFQKYTHESGRPMEDFIKRKMIDVWTQLSDRRLAWLETLGVLGKVRLRTGEDGLPGYHGMPSEADGRCLDDAYAGRLVQRALEDPRNRL